MAAIGIPAAIMFVPLHGADAPLLSIVIGSTRFTAQLRPLPSTVERP
jgi:hypothetical protein